MKYILCCLLLFGCCPQKQVFITLPPEAQKALMDYIDFQWELLDACATADECDVDEIYELMTLYKIPSKFKPSQHPRIQLR